MKKFLSFFIWTLIIFGLCSMPGKAIPKISWLELLSFDKLVHAGIFFIEQVLFMRVLQPYKWGKWAALLFCLGYGAALELMQSYVFSERGGDVFDFIANATGALLGLLLYDTISKKFTFLQA